MGLLTASAREWKGASYDSKCSYCGKFIPKGTVHWDWGTTGSDPHSSLYCSKQCCLAAHGQGGNSSGGSSGGSGGSLLGGIAGGIAGAAAARKAEKEAQEKAEQAEREARHKAAIQAIKDFQFDYGDDESFNRSAIMFLEEYNTCNAGLMADTEYKRVYTKRVKSELKVLKTQNSAYAEKLENLFEKAKAEMKMKLKKKLIISAIVLGVTTVLGLIWGISGVTDDVNAGIGLLAGLFAGFIFSTLPQMGSSNNRREDNE